MRNDVLRLVCQSGAALLVASLVVVTVVLPAESGLDPTGFGQYAGLLALGQSRNVAFAHFYTQPLRSDEVVIVLPAEAELEYKVRMRQGAALVFAWSAPQGTLLYADFHGESVAPASRQQQSYRIDGKQEGQEVRASNGALIAPFDGVHGWYWANLTRQPATVRLRLSGFYEILSKN